MMRRFFCPALLIFKRANLPKQHELAQKFDAKLPKKYKIARNFDAKSPKIHEIAQNFAQNFDTLHQSGGPVPPQPPHLLRLWLTKKENEKEHSYLSLLLVIYP